MTGKDIYEALRTVRHPQTGQDIVESGMIQKLVVDGNDVQFSLLLPALNVPYKSDLNFAIMGAIQSRFPKADVHIHTVATATPGGKPKETTSATPQIKNVIAVASGKGGVGKSTVSVNLALGLQQLGARVGLMDADLYGPSIPTMLGLQNERPPVEDIQGKPRIKPLEAFGIHMISLGNIVDPEQAVVLRGPRLGGIIRQFFTETLWPPLDYLVVDLPPGTGDIQLTLVQTVPVTGVVMVTTPQEVALADAVKAMNMFMLPSVNVPILGVVENMSWFTPAELPNNKYFIFGQGGGKHLAKASESMLLGQIPLVQSVREGGDNGKPAILNSENPVSEAFKKVAQNTIRQVAVRNEMLGPTQQVKMQS